MSITTDDRHALDALEARIRLLLPAQYQERYETVQPAPMRGAGLVFGADGKVAWDEIWQSFCDLAMAGGPPHKGRLLEPGTAAEVAAAPDRYEDVVEEIGRGVWLAAALEARPSPIPGRIRVSTYGEGMASWLLRAITMENVAVRRHRLALDLPAAPHFQVEKEIKNVVTVVAKTCHYWMGHVPHGQQHAVGTALAGLDAETPLVEPAEPDAAGLEARAADMAAAIAARTGLAAAPARYRHWLGLACPSVGAAVWMMRALVASNVLARREELALFVPVPADAPSTQAVVAALAHVHRLAGAAEKL